MNHGTSLPETITLHVPFRMVKRGGRKEMQMPDGATQPRRTDNTLVKVLARAFRWKRMLESVEFATIADLARQEGISRSYVTRLLGLTLLSPRIVEAILDGKRQGGSIDFLEPVSLLWSDQEAEVDTWKTISEQAIVPENENSPAR